jgi:hypothetical protein
MCLEIKWFKGLENFDFAASNYSSHPLPPPEGLS